MYIVLFLSFLVTLASSKKFVVTLQPQQINCFHELFELNQKFSIDSMPHTTTQYTLHLGFYGQTEVLPIYEKRTSQSQSIHKIAPHAGSYQICFTAHSQQSLRLTISIQSGLQLMSFESLAGNSQSQNINGEIDVLQAHTDNIKKLMDGMQGLKLVSMDYASMMDFYMLGFAVLGLVGLLAVNATFYIRLKKMLKNRKLI